MHVPFILFAIHTFLIDLIGAALLKFLQSESAKLTANIEAKRASYICPHVPFDPRNMTHHICLLR